MELHVAMNSALPCDNTSTIFSPSQAIPRRTSVGRRPKQRKDVTPSLPFPATTNNVSIRDSFSLPASDMGLRNFSVVPEVH